jgi:hypothetical protein
MSADDIEVGFILYFFFIVFDVATVNLSTCASPTNDARHFQQYFSYIVAVSLFGGRIWCIRKKPPTCRKSLTNFIT